MSKKCNECGNTNVKSVSCPDCGSDNLVEIAGQTVEAQPSEQVVIEESEAAVVEQPGMITSKIPTMPNFEVTPHSTPVVATISLKGDNDQKFELREGESFLVASERTQERVDLELSDAQHPGVSSTPFMIFIRGGEIFATGGGNGTVFRVLVSVEKPLPNRKVTTIDEFKPTEEALLQIGQSVIIGKATTLKIS